MNTWVGSPVRMGMGDILLIFQWIVNALKSYQLDNSVHWKGCTISSSRARQKNGTSEGTSDTPPPLLPLLSFVTLESVRTFFAKYFLPIFPNCISALLILINVLVLDPFKTYIRTNIQIQILFKCNLFNVPKKVQ